ncbi:MAG: transcriptional regulator [Thaumarchaeota archaeon]|nr:MAG: transcriptional regulator [Nitrososphaerota archaeon]
MNTTLQRGKLCDFGSNRRDEIEIMTTVLDLSMQPIKKTHLLYRANLNFKQLQRYLQLLQELGLIESVKNPFNGFRITEKGKLFIKIISP